jgi:hypothetical protein
MIMPGAALFFILALAGVALWANSRFRDEARLPMQWWLTGEVTWSAPRPFALAFVPALGAATLAIFAMAAAKVQPRPGQEGLVVPAFVGLGTLFVAVQLLHLWLVEKALSRKGS